MCIIQLHVPSGILPGAEPPPEKEPLVYLLVPVERHPKKYNYNSGLIFLFASLLLTGSPNSFSKYGRGDAAPSHPTLVLMTLLDRRPELLAEIEALALAPTR